MKDKKEIERRMQAGGITGASFATVDSQGQIALTPVGSIPDHDLQPEVKEDTVFQCASLSKPVFAYLVLKLIEANKTKSDEEDWVGKFKTNFNLKTPLYEVFKDEGVVLKGDNNPFLKLFSDQELAKRITAEMVLSHTTGLPIVGNPPYQFQFEPPGTQGCDFYLMSELPESLEQYKISYIYIKKNDTRELYYIKPDGEYEKVHIVDFDLFEEKINSIKNKDDTQFHLSEEQIKNIVTSNGGHTRMHYAYSGPGIECLQVTLKELTGSNLETLAQEHIFGPLKMPKSTYSPEGIAANSLKTTAEEYAKFITTWINDDKLNYAFTPVTPADSMKSDYLPNPKSVGRLVAAIDIKDEVRDLVAWGLGMGLVKNKEGQVIGVYHTGDMGNSTAEWRSGVGAVIDPESKRCIEASVYLTKSPNGHILAEQVLPSILKPGLDYFFPTYGFARNPEELDGTNFHGMNPRILQSELSKVAYKTKASTQHLEPTHQSVANPSNLPKLEEDFNESTDSTRKMFHQMNINPLSSRPEPLLKTDKSQEKEISSTKPVQEVKKTEEDKMEGEPIFNPTPLTTSFDPYKK
ncbi:serine hydrolase [Fluoribacter dumoffii]|uniref:serine hydrolase domain-containing protein n=1 Tax=Fluoribacter dumoffii TaxID=463 RepID=UPI002242CE2F|nr:serine hydrolase [Fluoribacter dumoffii]MCW8385444.1 serine hydrolase [Fluoribacter dumoffii]MCW8496259.1 serine hydrolase [Fluoribacter dumoffii]